MIGGSIVIEGGLEQCIVDTSSEELACNRLPDTGTSIGVTVEVVSVSLLVDVGMDGRRGIKPLS